MAAGCVDGAAVVDVALRGEQRTLARFCCLLGFSMKKMAVVLSAGQRRGVGTACWLEAACGREKCDRLKRCLYLTSRTTKNEGYGLLTRSHPGATETM